MHGVVKRLDNCRSQGLTGLGFPAGLAPLLCGSAYQWHADCLRTGRVALEGEALVYCSPENQSDSKTFVSEVLMLSRLVKDAEEQHPDPSKRRKRVRKKGIWIVPVPSVERVSHLQSLCTSLKLNVRGYFSNQGSGGPLVLPSVDVAVCTVDKANEIINQILEAKRLHEVSIVVVEDMHLFRDEEQDLGQDRGFGLEMMLTKLLYHDKDRTIQIVAHSAAAPANIRCIADWLGGNLYQTDDSYRSVPLAEWVKVGADIYSKSMQYVRSLPVPTPARDVLEVDQDNIALLCEEVMAAGDSVLVFCPSEMSCENCAKTVATLLPHVQGGSVQAARKGLLGQLRAMVAEAELDADAGSIHEATIPAGVALYTEAIPAEERDIIHRGFAEGTLCVLMVTPSLASSSDLFAKRVVICSPQAANDRFAEPWTQSAYRQIIERAGRAGKDASGESFLVCRPEEKADCVRLMDAKLPALHSSLEGPSQNMGRALLEAIASGMSKTLVEIQRFVQCTLLAALQTFAGVQELTSRTMADLLKRNVIQWCGAKERYEATGLGRAIFSSGLSLAHGMAVYDELQSVRRHLVLDDGLHMLYLITSPNRPPLSNLHLHLPPAAWEALLNRYASLPGGACKVAELVGVSESWLSNAAQTQTQTQAAAAGISTGPSPLVSVHCRFFGALILWEMAKGFSLVSLTKQYHLPRSFLQRLQEEACTFAGMVSTLCEGLDWWDLRLLLAHVRERTFSDFQAAEDASRGRGRGRGMVVSVKGSASSLSISSSRSGGSSLASRWSSVGEAEVPSSARSRSSVLSTDAALGLGLGLCVPLWSSSSSSSSSSPPIHTPVTVVQLSNPACTIPTPTPVSTKEDPSPSSSPSSSPSPSPSLYVACALDQLAPYSCFPPFPAASSETRSLAPAPALFSAPTPTPAPVPAPAPGPNVTQCYRVQYGPDGLPKPDKNAPPGGLTLGYGGLPAVLPPPPSTRTSGVKPRPGTYERATRCPHRNKKAFVVGICVECYHAMRGQEQGQDQCNTPPPPPPPGPVHADMSRADRRSSTTSLASSFSQDSSPSLHEPKRIGRPRGRKKSTSAIPVKSANEEDSDEDYTMSRPKRRRVGSYNSIVTAVAMGVGVGVDGDEAVSVVDGRSRSRSRSSVSDDAEVTVTSPNLDRNDWRQCAHHQVLEKDKDAGAGGPIAIPVPNPASSVPQEEPCTPSVCPSAEQRNHIEAALQREQERLRQELERVKGELGRQQDDDTMSASSSDDLDLGSDLDEPELNLSPMPPAPTAPSMLQPASRPIEALGDLTDSDDDVNFYN